MRRQDLVDAVAAANASTAAAHAAFPHGWWCAGGRRLLRAAENAHKQASAALTRFDATPDTGE